MTDRNKSMPDRPSSTVANLVGFAVATGQEAREIATRRRMMPVRLTDAEREVCFGELGEHFTLGRLDKAELDRRLDQLHAAVTHADLQPVFAGLPIPPLYAAQESRSPSRWRWAVFTAAVGMAVPFLLLGLVFLVFGREIAAVVFGLPAFAWVFFTWRWASGRRHSRRRR
jgi:hypothetical protein